jgi:type I restriction enzyme S subunit
MSALPSNWEMFPLESVAEVRLGRQRSPKNHDGDQMRHYVRAANVGWRGLSLDDVKQMNFTDAEMEIYRLRVGDLLLNEASGSAAEVGKPAVWRGEIKDCAFQNTLIRVRPLQVDSDYLLHYFRNQAVLKNFAAAARGVGIHHLGREALASWMIPLPPAEEQRRIASLLEQADRLCAKRREGLNRLAELTQSTFVDMFGHPGINPKNWPVVRIGDMLESAIYGTSEKASMVGEVPVLRMGNITYDGSIDTTNLKYLGSASVGDRYRVRPGDVLFNRTNSADLVGKAAIYRGREPMAYAGYLVRLRVNAHVNPEYLSAYLNTRYCKRVLRNMAKSIVGMANINAKEVQEIAIPQPPLSLQNEFAARMTRIESVRGAHRAGLAELDALFASLQEMAFRGAL